MPDKDGLHKNISLSFLKIYKYKSLITDSFTENKWNKFEIYNKAKFVFHLHEMENERRKKRIK